MKLGEVVKRVIINHRKLTDYALDPDNPTGRHKALIFERCLGFTRDNCGSLIQQIEALALDGEALLQRTDQYGRHYRVDLEVTGTGGQQAIVRTGWVVTPGSDEAQLVTSYVLRKS